MLREWQGLSVEETAVAMGVSHETLKDTPGDGKLKAGLGGRHTRELTAELDAAVDAIDDSTVRRLAGARREALAQDSGKHRRRLLGSSWATATAGLAALLVVVLLWVEPADNNADLIVTDNGSTTLESLPILLSSEDLEFYQSVEFLLWMEKNSG